MTEGPRLSRPALSLAGGLPVHDLGPEDVLGPGGDLLGKGG
jgi:hypothetical protein